MRSILEGARETNVVHQFDVIVCGGGPAGVAAAIGAARAGAKTCIIETQGALGGVWTSGNLSFIIDEANKGGILQELFARIDHYHARQGQACEPEVVKLVLEQLCAELNIHVRLHTRVVAAHVNDSNQLQYVMTESKSGREAWQSKVFIDCTGDGDVAALAGSTYELGEDGTGQTQPMSLIAVLAGIPAQEAERFIKYSLGARDNLYREFQRAGVDPSYSKPALWHPGGELCLFMGNHQYNVSGLNADDISRATISARREIFDQILALKALGGIWKNIKIVSIAAQIGVREGRRIMGRYKLTVQDLVNGTKHEDGICRVTFPVDVHALDPNKGKSYGTQGVFAQPYDIPLRALIAKDVDGLMMAGRCISGDFFAHASYRVTGNAATMGEAAGVAAALAALSDLMPHEVPAEQVIARLNIQLKN
jgi:hypothetical protein